MGALSSDSLDRLRVFYIRRGHLLLEPSVTKHVNVPAQPDTFDFNQLLSIEFEQIGSRMADSTMQ